MVTFKDNKGREWSLALTVGTVRRVQELTGVNLGACDREMFVSLATDFMKLVDVICAVVRPQLAAKDIADEDFAEALGGDELQSATDALLSALVDFSPPKKRPVLRQAIEALNAMQDQIMARATARLGELTLSEVLAFGESSGTAPESPALIPFPLVSPICSPAATPVSVTNGT